jgi:hypothetical protein
MRLKPLTIALVLGAALPIAAAHAAPAGGIKSAAGVKLAGCQSGDLTTDRKATFTGHMRSVSGSSQLAMRFRLLEQYGGKPFEPVAAPDLRKWRKSSPGVQSYSYSQTVNGLFAGESYRAEVQFRWLDSNGKPVAQIRRVSGVCLEPGTLPNLKVIDVNGRPGGVAGTEAYTVDVLNAGLAPALHVSLQLVVDGATPDIGSIDSLAPGEIHPIRFTGPSCRHRVRATVDPSDAIHETDESDNSLAVPCPPQG